MIVIASKKIIPRAYFDYNIEINITHVSDVNIRRYLRMLMETQKWTAHSHDSNLHFSESKIGRGRPKKKN